VAGPKYPPNIARHLESTVTPNDPTVILQILISLLLPNAVPVSGVNFWHVSERE